MGVLPGTHAVPGRGRTPPMVVQKIRRKVRAALGRLPPLVDTPEAAWARSGEHAAYRCDPMRCTHPIGLRFDSWNPFIETSRAILRGETSTYETSTLRRFHERFQPRHAAEAIVGFNAAPPELERWPPVVGLCAPWESLAPAAMIEAVRAWNASDYAEAGGEHTEPDRGHKYFGPVSPSLGSAEYRRVEFLTRSISHHGFARRNGDVSLIVLKRGNEYLGVTSGGGMHRTLVAAAAGIASVSARPRLLADIDRIDSWPHIRSGLWSVDRARALCDHLFDFDFAAWATARGIR